MSTLDALNSVFTAKQIVTLAERIANHPGLHLTSNGVEPGTGSYSTNPLADAPAYAALQMILDELALTQTFTFTRTAYNMEIAARHNNLPTNFWRVGFADPCFLFSDTANALDRSQFYLLDAQQFHRRFQDGVTGRPEVGFINRDTGVLTVDPAPDATYTLELHYYPWQPALATVTDYPWFPSARYLMNELLCTLYLRDSDPRWATADAERKDIMRKIKHSMGDSTDRASLSVDLDPTLYHRPIEL